jgi:hypothetical protein
MLPVDPGETENGGADSALVSRISAVPLFELTPEQLTCLPFLVTMVYIVQDVWHSMQRILKHLPKWHANFISLRTGIQKVYRICRPNASGPLTVTADVTLKDSIDAEVETFQRDLQALKLKFSDYVVHTRTTLAEGMAKISEAHSRKQLQQTDAVQQPNAGQILEEQSFSPAGLVQQATDPFQDMLVDEITRKQIHDCRKVRFSRSTMQ